MSISETISIPELSRQAWEQMRSCLNQVPDAKVIQAINSLRLSEMPDAAQVLQSDPELWVAAYENALADISRKARRQGALQSGVFYTPMPVARYLVQQTLGARLQAAMQAIQSAIQTGKKETADTELARIQALRIMDPACGTGVFLVAALERLIDFYISHEVPNPAETALAQLHGIDIDPLAIWIAEARLYQCAIQLSGSKANHFPVSALPNFQVGDALLTETTHPRWDFILGNPPYVSEVRGQAELFRALKAAESPYYRAKMDLCDAFLAWAMDHLAVGGALAYVLPEYWMQRSSTATLRQRLWQEGDIRELWTFPNQALFEAAPGHHTSLLIWERGNIEDHAPCRPLQLGIGKTEPSPSALQSGRVFLNPASGKLIAGTSEEITLLARLSNLPPLLHPSAIQQGIVLPQGRLKKADLTRLQALQQKHSHDFNGSNPSIEVSTGGLFLLTTDEIEALGLNDAERALLHPWYGPTGFQPFTGFPQNPATANQPSAAKPDYWLITMNNSARKRLVRHPEHYPTLKAHFDRMAPLNTSAFAPYGLHRARQPEWFEGEPRILCPRQVLQPACAVVDAPAYVGEGFYVIRPAESDDLHLLTAMLNSRLAWFWFYHQKRKGQRLQIDKDVLCAFPAPPDDWRSRPESYQLASLAQQLSSSLSLGTRSDALVRLNSIAETIYSLSIEEKSLLDDWTSRLHNQQ